MAIMRNGRQPSQTRPVIISYDGLARVDGSARFSFASTSALASFSGPIEIRPTQENPSIASLDVQVRPLSHVPATESKAMASMIRSALLPSLVLTNNPRTLIQLVVQTLSDADQGGMREYEAFSSGKKSGKKRERWMWDTVASMLNASTLAVLNAGSLPMKGVVCAVPIALVSPSSASSLIVDPDEDEQQNVVAGGCFAFMFGDVASSDTAPCVLSQWRTCGDVVDVVTFGDKEFREARDMARVAAKDVWSRMKESIAERLGVSSLKNDDDDDDDEKMEI